MTNFFKNGKELGFPLEGNVSSFYEMLVNPFLA